MGLQTVACLALPMHVPAGFTRVRYSRAWEGE